MRIWVCCLVISLISATSWAQKDRLAENYFQQGEYQKALGLYQRLVKEQPRQPKYVLGLMRTYQQLSQFSEAENLLKARLNGPRVYPLYYVALADNFNRQRQIDSAQVYIDKAIDYAFDQPNYTISIGKSLTDLSLLHSAKVLYQGVMQRHPDKNYNLQLARVYGELGELESMFDTYLSLMETTPRFIPSIRRYLETYITEDRQNQGNILLKKALITRLSERPDSLYNTLLSWLFTRQREYNKAFIQEKALYLRGGDLSNLRQLGQTALNNQELPIAKTIFSYILSSAADPRIQLSAQLEILRLDRRLGGRSLEEIEQIYTKLIQEYQPFDQTQLILDYADFLAYDKVQSAAAIALLNKTANQSQKPYSEGQLRMLLGDLLVFDGQYNDALVNYALVQSILKDDDLAQEAKFKEAQTSYFRGDFKWAQTQLKILKSSTAQKMSNDAIALHVLINENTVDEEAEQALKDFAAAQLLAYQNKYTEAITALETMQNQSQSNRLADDVHHSLAQLFRRTQAPDLAQEQWKLLLRDYPDSVYVDDALYALADLMSSEFNNPPQAKVFLEEIIFNHADSIYFIEAQKQYRALRGDPIN